MVHDENGVLHASPQSPQIAAAELLNLTHAVLASVAPGNSLALSCDQCSLVGAFSTSPESSNVSVAAGQNANSVV